MRGSSCAVVWIIKKLEDFKMGIVNDFDTMFGSAPEVVPDPADMESGEFDALDEEDAGGEEELTEMDCSGIEVELDTTEEEAEVAIKGAVDVESLPAFDAGDEETKASPLKGKL